MTSFDQWAATYPEAARALQRLYPLPPDPPDNGSEARIQGLVRLEGARKGYRLWRNNKGVLPDRRGVPLRFGLANDTKQLSDQLASADLIGWDPVGRFVSVEVKKAGGVIADAQKNWAALVEAGGGLALIVNQEGMLP